MIYEGEKNEFFSSFWKEFSKEDKMKLKKKKKLSLTVKTRGSFPPHAASLAASTSSGSLSSRPPSSTSSSAGNCARRKG